MSLFNDRKDSFEKQFAHDQELRFKATARRNKLMGLWVAERLGKTGPEAEAYAKTVVAADFEEPGDGDVLRKVRQDLEDAGKSVDETELGSKMQQLLIQVVEDIKAGR
ncbi:MAG: DUF1476 domain-containing protein [Microvirga sp.]